MYLLLILDTLYITAMKKKLRKRYYIKKFYIASYIMTFFNPRILIKDFLYINLTKCLIFIYFNDDKIYTYRWRQS